MIYNGNTQPLNDLNGTLTNGLDNTFPNDAQEVSKDVVIKVKFAELGRRLDESIRGKELTLSSVDVETITNNIVMATDVRGAGIKPTDGLTGNLIGLTDSTCVANISGGWNQSRFMITVISKKDIGLNGTIYTVTQGFTNDTDVLTAQISGDVVFNYKAIMHINRISQFKDSGNGLMPYKAMNVISNRWSDESLLKMRPTDIHNYFDMMDGVGDSRVTYNSVVNTSNITNSGVQFVGKLIDSTVSGVQHNIANKSNLHDMGARSASENGIGNISIVRSFMTSGGNMNERFDRSNPSYLTLGFLNTIANSIDGLSGVSEIILDDKTTDMALVQTGRGMTQEYTTSNGLETKANAELAEIIGDIAMNYDLDSLLVTYTSLIPSAANDYANYTYDKNSVISDFVIPDIMHGVKIARTQLAIDEIGVELYRIYGLNGFNIDIELLGSTSITIKTSIGGQHGVATQHNYYASSLYNSIITTKQPLSNVAVMADNLAHKFRSGLLSVSADQLPISNGFNTPQAPAVQTTYQMV